MTLEPIDRGPLHTYEITWKNGHVERIHAHQCSIPNGFGSMFGAPSQIEPRIVFHGEFDGHWQLILAVPESEILIVRNASRSEVI